MLFIGSGVYPVKTAKFMVAAAIDYAQEYGVAAVLDKINVTPSPEFVDGEIYVYVYDAVAEVVAAHSVKSARIGQDVRASSVDIAGRHFGAEILDRATPQGGWFQYVHENPATGERDSKAAWAVRSGDLIFAAGSLH